MKKLFILLVLQLISYSVWSQTMSIHYKNGKTVEFNMDNIDYVEFIDDGDNETISGDYLKVTLDGKSYSDKILNWHIAQVDPVGYDKDGNPLTLTYDMRDHFEDNGFSFLFGIVHFSRKNDLLASPVGAYGCAESILSDDYYNNLTFWSTLEIDYKEYKWISGTHNVKSIKEVDGKVQIEGDFTSTFSYGSDSKTVKGSYRMTIP